MIVNEELRISRQIDIWVRCLSKDAKLRCVVKGAEDSGLCSTMWCYSLVAFDHHNAY